MRRLEAFGMWIYRRILGISLIERVNNMEVMRRMHKEREVIPTILKRKLEYGRHIMRGEKFRILQTIMQGEI